MLPIWNISYTIKLQPYNGTYNSVKMYIQVERMWVHPNHPVTNILLAIKKKAVTHCPAFFDRHRLHGHGKVSLLYRCPALRLPALLQPCLWLISPLLWLQWAAGHCPPHSVPSLYQPTYLCAHVCVSVSGNETASASTGWSAGSRSQFRPTCRRPGPIDVCWLAKY